MVRYVSGASRTFWGIAFKINAWALLYTLWPTAYIVFLALAGDGRFRPFDIPVYNCSIADTAAARSLGYYDEGGAGDAPVVVTDNATNTTNATVATMLVRRPNATAAAAAGFGDEWWPEEIARTTEPARYGLTLNLTDCLLHSVLPVGDLHPNARTNSTAAAAMIAFVGPTPGQQVPALAILVVGVLFLASVLAYAQQGVFENTWRYEGQTCINRLCLFTLRTSVFDITLNSMMLLGLALLAFYPTGPGPDTWSAHALCAPLYYAAFITVARPFYLGLKIKIDGGGDVNEAALPAEIAIFAFGVACFIQVPCFAAFLDGAITGNVLVALSPALIAFTLVLTCIGAMWAGLCHEVRSEGHMEAELMPIIARYYSSATTTLALLVCLVPAIHFLGQQLSDPNAVAAGAFPRPWIVVAAPLMAFAALECGVWFCDGVGDALHMCAQSCAQCRKSATRRALEAAAAALRTTTPAAEQQAADDAVEKAKLARQQEEKKEDAANAGAAAAAAAAATAEAEAPGDKLGAAGAAADAGDIELGVTAHGGSAGGDGDDGKSAGDGKRAGGEAGNGGALLPVGTRVTIRAIDDDRFMVRDGILQAARMHSGQHGRVHAWVKETGRYSVILGNSARAGGLLVSVLPAFVEAGSPGATRSRLLKLLGGSQADAAAAADADAAELEERRQRMQEGWDRELASLVESRNAIALRLSLVALNTQLTEHPVELCTELNRGLLIRAAEMFLAQGPVEAARWTDEIKLNYGRVLRHFTGAARLLAAARANGGDDLGNPVPFPGAPPKPN